MSIRTAVKDTPVLVLFGTQPFPQTVVNTGESTVYVSDDSAVSAKVDLAIGQGASMVVDAGAVLWAVCDTGQKTTLTTLTNYNERFSYGQYAGKLLDFRAYAGVTGYVAASSPWDSDLSTQYQGVSIGIQANTNALAAGVWTIEWDDYNGNIGGGTPSFGRKQEVRVNVYNTLGVGSPTAFTGAIFPVYGFGGEYTVTAPAGTSAGDWSVVVYGLPNAPSQALPWGRVDSQYDATYTWENRGNSWVAVVGNIAANTTTDVRCPPMPGPVRLFATYTQTGAGSVSVTPRFLPSASSLPIDAALVSSTAAGTYTGWATYAVWPTAAPFIRITCPAGVTLSGVSVYLIAGAE